MGKYQKTNYFTVLRNTKLICVQRNISKNTSKDRVESILNVGRVRFVRCDEIIMSLANLNRNHDKQQIIRNCC